jgi:ADP-heptose:LPS heptosyltransferase
VWSGNAAYSADRTRSMPPEVFAPLLEVPGVSWFAPQRDVTDEAARVLEHAGVTRVGDQLGDFAEIAAFVANLDLVVTVDTSFAHVAGALGRPLWLMLSHSPHWPWMLGRDETAWYPTARIFRQHSPGEWGPAVESAAAALRQFARG